MTLRIFRATACLQHDMGKQHPESPDRLDAIDDQLLSSGLDMICEHADATQASREQLIRAHDPYYIDSVFQQAPTRGITWLDSDTGMMPATLDAALFAAGAGCDAVDWVMQGSDRQAFCAVRPPGHHAEYDAAMGFCLFNNVVVAARHALAQYHLQRVAIVDFDVHHGNGTEHIVAGDRQILFCSSFQHPFYPHSGYPPSASNLLPVPLEPGLDGAGFRQAVSHWFAALRHYQPQLLLVSAGFDAHAEDGMSYLRLREADYQWLSAQLRAVADHCCDGRIVSLLEGGYSFSALGRSVVAHLRGLTGQAATHEIG